MELLFKKITTNDVATLLVIENNCHSHPWSEKTFKSCIGERYFGYSIEQEGNVVGFYVGEYILGEATLMDICVSPNFQGSGIGKKLLNHFTQQAVELGSKTLFLEVRAKNLSALMMYINDGFNEISRRTGYYPSAVGFGYEDAIVMKKVISK